MQKVAQPYGLRAIAERAKVSVSLVSRVLNDRLGNARVSAKTVSAIREAASELGYRKNHAAAALVTGRQNVVGGFIHRVGVEGSGLVEQLVCGMAAGAAERGQRLMLRFFSSDEEFVNYMPEISPALLDGLMVGGFRHVDLFDKLCEIEKSGVRVVTVHEDFDPKWAEAFSTVYVDPIRVCDLATEHLISLGCRRIAHVSWALARRDGYCRALVRHGIPVDPALIYSSRSFYAESGTLAVEHFRANGIDYDGIVTQSDEQAIGAINALVMAGRKVPEEIKVIGVDDSAAARRLCIVPVSSVTNQYYEQGLRAAQLLADRVAGQAKVTCQIDPIVRARNSTIGRPAPTASA